MIHFRQDDNDIIRADKIWRALGFVNDRMGAIPMLAGFMSMYRQMDEQAAKDDTKTPPD